MKVRSVLRKAAAQRQGMSVGVFFDDRLLGELLVEKQSEHRDKDVIGRTRDGVRSDHIEDDESDDERFDEVGVVDLFDQFIDDVVCEATWDLLPFNFLYDVYKVWFKENSPSGSVQGKNTFINDIVHSIQGNSEWYCLGATHQIRTAHYMDAEEPLAKKYKQKYIINNEIDKRG